MDLYSQTNGGRISGKPVYIVHSYASGSPGDIIIASEKDMVSVRRNDFEKGFNFEDFFIVAPPLAERKITSYTVSSFTAATNRREFLIMDNKVYYTGFTAISQDIGTVKFGFPRGGSYGQLAPLGITFGATAFGAIVYDQTNKRFMYAGTSGNVLSFPAQAPPAGGFDVNNVGMEILFSDRGRLYYENSVMKNGADYALCISNFNNSTAASTNIGLNKYSMNACPGIAGISSFAPGEAGEFVYYSSGSDVHLFKYNDASPYEKVWTAPAGEVVTCLRLQTYAMTTLITNATAGMINPYEVIYIGTWNESTQTGTVYTYKVNSTSGAVDTSVERKYT